MIIFVVMLLVVVSPMVACNGRVKSESKAGFFLTIGAVSLACMALGWLLG